MEIQIVGLEETQRHRMARICRAALQRFKGAVKRVTIKVAGEPFKKDGRLLLSAHDGRDVLMIETGERVEGLTVGLLLRACKWLSKGLKRTQ